MSRVPRGIIGVPKRAGQYRGNSPTAKHLETAFLTPLPSKERGGGGGENARSLGAIKLCTASCVGRPRTLILVTRQPPAMSEGPGVPVLISRRLVVVRRIANAVFARPSSIRHEEYESLRIDANLLYVKEANPAWIAANLVLLRDSLQGRPTCDKTYPERPRVEGGRDDNQGRNGHDPPALGGVLIAGVETAHSSEGSEMSKKTYGCE